MMNTKAAKRLALLVVLVMAVLYLPVSGLATGTKAYTWYGFTVDTDAQYTLVDMNGIQHLYVEKGASVSVAADFFCTGAAGSPTFSWSYLIDSE